MTIRVVNVHLITPLSVQHGKMESNATLLKCYFKLT